MKLKAYSAISYQGPVLNINEDDFEIDLNKNLFMIFDGFGGAGIGDKAVSEIKNNIKEFYLKMSGDPNSTMPFFYSPHFLPEANSLINSILFAHEKLNKQNEQLAISKRGGASGIIACSSESILNIVSIGNCSAYLFRKGELSPIFIPDDFLFLGDDDFEKHFRTIPKSAFGLFSDLKYQVKEVKIHDGDKIILLSDGAYSRLQGPQILHTLIEENLESKEKINSLFELSNNRGNLDNQTGMILEF